MPAQNLSYFDPRRFTDIQTKVNLNKVKRDYETNTGFEVKSSLREG